MAYEADVQSGMVYDLGDFHGDCNVSPHWVGYPALFCNDCHVLGHIDLVSKSITPSSGKRVRTGEGEE
jgi:hypothetical protein